MAPCARACALLSLVGRQGLPVVVTRYSWSGSGEPSREGSRFKGPYEEKRGGLLLSSLTRQDRVSKRRVVRNLHRCGPSEWVLGYVVVFNWHPTQLLRVSGKDDQPLCEERRGEIGLDDFKSERLLQSAVHLLFGPHDYAILDSQSRV